MPPKKKKAPINHVVGTVSTRSTRRQSIVNIEIPKLSRSKSTKDFKSRSSTTPEEDKDESDEFSERIKQSFNKFMVSPPKASLPPVPPKEAGDKDNNRALLEILQDWEDDEDDQSESNQSQSGIKSGQNSFKSFEESNSDVSELSENKQMELMLSEGLEDEVCLEKAKEISKLTENSEESENSTSTKESSRGRKRLPIPPRPNNKLDISDDFKVDEDQGHSQHVDFEAPKDESAVSLGGSVQNETEDVIIEENASIPYADDMLVDQPQIEQKIEETSTPEEETVTSEEVFPEGEILEGAIIETISEASQPKSEAENEEMECAPNTEVQDIEEHIFKQQGKSNIELIKEPPDEEDNKIMEAAEEPSSHEENNSFVQPMVEETNDTISSEKSDDAEPLKIEVEKMECEFEADKEEINTNTEEIAEHKEEKIEEISTSEEPKNEEQFNFSLLSQEKKQEIYENLESKVAEMNLSDETLIKKRAENANLITQDEKSIDESATTTENIIETIEPALKEDKAKTKKETSKQARRSKSSEEKFPSKPPKPKSPRSTRLPTLRVRDRKPKDLKIKKQLTEKQPKKPKDKTTFKDPEKLDKKPEKTEKKLEKSDKKPEKSDKKSEKKLTKFEEALQCIAKVDAEGDEVRRSSRIKSISIQNRKTSGWGLVKSKSDASLMEGDVSDSNNSLNESERSTPSASPKVTPKNGKSKSNPDSPVQTPVKTVSQVMEPYRADLNSKVRGKDPIVEARLKQFVHLKENLYKTDRMVCKEAKKMVCDCFLTKEEMENKDYGCGEDCLNRLLMIECGNLCTVGERCTNKRFQKNFFAPVEVFNTDKKGLGLRAAANIPFGEFILEYVGEVLSSDEFEKRAEVYSQDKNIHYYFMALRADAIIDATMKGNISRFINHSCDPNAETQKWTVNGELRIGFFSTRTILAGEEVTFDYRFQRYGKEAQKCYCGASICRGWLGEQPDSDEEEEEEEEEEETEDAKPGTPLPQLEIIHSSDLGAERKVEVEVKTEHEAGKEISSDVPSQGAAVPATLIRPVRKKVPKKKTRIEMFEEVDQLIEEIEMLVETGLKNQAHTLKLSRLMVRAKEPQQRAKLLRVLRRGELPCRRLFLDYHGLRLMHGYMIDAQQLVITNKKFESLRLEMLQTLAVLPIPNKTMLQDSKVLPTVENWSTDKHLTSPGDSESNSPKDGEPTQKPTNVKEETETSVKDEVLERSIEDQEEEIRFLATKLLEEWKNLKEVFRIPKKERIEQMKEHEREANKKFMQTNQNMYGSEEDKKMDRYDRYRGIGRIREKERDGRRPPRPGDKPSAEFLRLSKVERRKLFALQHELKEEERKMKQREMWRQHEMNCMMIGADPRFTAPFDPSRGFQYIWNQQIGQWQTLPISNTRHYPSQNPNQLPNLNMPPPHVTKPILPGYQYASTMSLQANMGVVMNQPHMPPLPQSHIPLPQPTMPPLPPGNGAQAYRPQIITPPLPQMPPPQVEEDPSQVKFMGPIPPPVKLPPKWKCAKDKFGRPYYFHISIRKSQWEPPPPPPETFELSESESSSESSTVSSDSSSENSDSDDDIDDTRLLIEVRRQMDRESNRNKLAETGRPELMDPDGLDDIPFKTPSPDEKMGEGDIGMDELKPKSLSLEEEIIRRPSIDMRLKELDFFKDDKPAKKKRRVGLCEEIIISPRTEEDKKQFKEDIKRYKANKEKLKRQKEKILLQTKKQLREIELKKAKEKRQKTTVKVKLKEKPDFNTEAAKKIKETFRANMASTVVSSLNFYRRPDCNEGKITNTQDFKHLARKLTHFVMLKEMKHIVKIEDLLCTDNVKMKAREFIRKYMGKFGEVYVKRSDSPDFKD